ncbi:MAG: S-layer homology domain-containing protein [Ruminococcaceae bacterium]|nr:S-layer homology domain-containing protein [Oscillospiraceae bacterium]
MKKTEMLRRAGSFMLSVAVLLGALGLVPISSAAAENAKEAYRQLVQRLVSEKGISEFDMGSADYVMNTNGVVSVVCQDMLGDSTEELFVVWLEPTTKDEDVYGTKTAVYAVYTYENGAIKEAVRELTNGGFWAISANRQGNRLLLTDSLTRSGADEGCLWDGSRFVHTSTLRDLTEAEMAEIERASSEQGLMGESGARWRMLLDRCGMVQEEVEHLFSVNGPGELFTSLNGEYLSPADCVAALGVKAPAEPVEKILEKMVYFGDRSKCMMTAEMARAYADAIRSIENPKAILVDNANDGMPLLLAGKSDWSSGYHVWSWDGDKATLFKNEALYGCANFGYYDEIPAIMICNQASYHHGYFFYKISKAALEPLHSLEFNADGNYWSWDGVRLSDGEGNMMDMPDYIDQWEDNKEVYPIYDENGPYNYRPNHKWAEGKDMIDLLEKYAEGYSEYPHFPRVNEGNDSYAAEVAAAAAASLNGEIKGIYKLADGVYYVVIVVDGGEQGAVVRCSRKDGQNSWQVTEKHATPLTPEELDALAARAVSVSNMSLSFGKISSFKNAEDLVDYLREALDNMDGLTPNDGAKTELSAFIESGLSAICAAKVSSGGNRLTVTAEVIEKVTQKAQEAKAAVDGLLLERGVMLDKPVTVIVRVLWKNCKNAKPCQITLDAGLKDTLGDCSLRLLLGDAQHYVQLSSQNLGVLTDQYGKLIIQFSKTKEHIYTINFLTEEETLIEQLSAPVTFGLPAGDVLSTIMASYAGGSDNWGGQYDENAKTISFETPYSGQYEVLENNIQIDDIGDLSAESQAAIRFMVSKGYLTLDGANFRPAEPLSRYQFTQALVGMFFALDRNLTTSFADVPADSEFYPYVASAEARAIVEGFTDTTFGGEQNMTVEQMLALASRTLIDQKGYTLPQDAELYLSSFSDREQIGDWARALVAMAVREGIMDRTELLNPQADITREQAALILYRLFLLLYEVPPVALKLPISVGAIVGICGGAAVVLGGGAAGWVFVKRKKARRAIDA